MALTYPEQERYQTYAETDGNQERASAPVSDLPKSPQRRAPCVDPQTATDSDLCAQWRAARGAEKAADWAMWGVLASIAGIIGLYWQIALTREAVQDTGRATGLMEAQNANAKDTAQRQLRAYVCAVGINWSILIIEGSKKVRLQLIWKNAGATPAVKVGVFGSVFFSEIDDNNLQGIEIITPKDNTTTIAPSMEVFGQESLVDLETINEVFSETKKCHIVGKAAYRDMFGHDHETRVQLRLRVMRDSLKPLIGDNITEIRWVVDGPYNGISEVT